jgi:hypothetical protein
VITGEGLGYDIGSVLFETLIIIGITVAVGYLFVKGRQKAKEQNINK